MKISCLIHFGIWPTVRQQLCLLTSCGIQGSLSSCLKARPYDSHTQTHTHLSYGCAGRGLWQALYTFERKKGALHLYGTASNVWIKGQQLTGISGMFFLLFLKNNNNNNWTLCYLFGDALVSVHDIQLQALGGCKSPSPPLPINADYSSDLHICLGGRELAVRACWGLQRGRKEGRDESRHALGAQQSRQPAVLTYLRNVKVGGGASMATTGWTMEWKALILTLRVDNTGLFRQHRWLALEHPSLFIVDMNSAAVAAQLDFLTKPLII